MFFVKSLEEILEVIKPRVEERTKELSRKNRKTQKYNDKIRNRCKKGC